MATNTWWTRARQRMAEGAAPLLFDGAMGTQLQARGVGGCETPAEASLSQPEQIVAIHRDYLAAGAELITCDSFSAPALALSVGNERAEEVVRAALACAREARAAAQREGDGRDLAIALDLGPTGQLLEPLGELGFEEAAAIYAALARIGEAEGADLVLVETMTESYELRAALVGVADGCALPVFATFSPDRSGRLLSGASIDVMVAMLESLGVAALGINCGFGPLEMEEMVARLAAIASVPVIVRPNAGLPQSGEELYLDPETYAAQMGRLLAHGIQIIGGCCGTTPEHIAALHELARSTAVAAPVARDRGAFASSREAYTLDDLPLSYGAIDAAADDALAEAWSEGDYDTLLDMALDLGDEGAELLLLAGGVAGQALGPVVSELQTTVHLPMIFGGEDGAAIADALRIYHGRPIVDARRLGPEALEALAPALRRYGPLVLGAAPQASAAAGLEDAGFEALPWPEGLTEI